MPQAFPQFTSLISPKNRTLPGIVQTAATSPASVAFLAEVGLAATEERLVSLALAVRLVAVRGMHPGRLGESGPGLAGLLV